MFSEKIRYFDILLFIIPLINVLVYIFSIIFIGCVSINQNEIYESGLYCGSGKHIYRLDLVAILNITGPVFAAISFIFVPPSILIRPFLRIALPIIEFSYHSSATRWIDYLIGYLQGVFWLR